MYTLEQFREDWPDDKTCLDWLLAEKYPNGCTVCGHKLHYIQTRKSYACSKHNQVSPLAGTIFHKSSTSLVKWFYVIYLYSTYGDKLNSRQIQRQIDVSYKTAWRMLWLIRDVYSPEYKKDILSSIGVYMNVNGRWRARTKVGDKTINLGTFSTKQAALDAYIEAKRILRTRPSYWAKK